MRWPAALLLLLAALAPGLATARTAEPTEGPLPVRAVIDGDTVVLGDGSELRLVGLQAPKLPLGRPNFPAWPLAEEAKAVLEALVLGRSVRLRSGGRDGDRHGRRLAHLYDAADGRWIQGAMLEAGWARVYSFADNRALVAEMLALERQARAARRGIWGHPAYRILNPDETGRHLDSFQLVEGRVVAVANVRGHVYLNFGEDWRRDFTISVPPRARRLFDRSGPALEALAGRRLRVRGWLVARNGPMIEATHPEQLEVLEE